MSDDLMFQAEIREVVRDAYRQIPGGAGRAVAERLYSAEELDAVPEIAVDWALGVGNPVRHADLESGEVVLDLGCGGGIDTVLAAVAVGPTGRVIGVDLLPEMCERARAAAASAGLDARCEIVEGEMEDLPLPEASVDVVISNGVPNLSPRKGRAFAEIARVLRPGGRVVLADLTVDEDLPPEVLASGAAWAGCISGALSERVFAKKLARAGLQDVELHGRTAFGVDDVALYPLFTPEVIDLMRRLIPAPAQQRVAVSLVARARRPQLEAPAPAGGGPRTKRDAGPASAPVDGSTARDGGAASVRPLESVPASRTEAEGVAVRPLKRVEDVSLKVLDVEAGSATPFHRHAHAHEGVVVSGTGALELEGDLVTLVPGDVFSVAPRQAHAIVAHGTGPLRFVCLDCFSE